MANPKLIIDQTVHHFMKLWSMGLQPSFSVKTLPNGEVVMQTNVSCSLDSKLIPSNSPHRRRSGNGARLRRQVKRSKVNHQSTILENESNHTCSDLNSAASAIEDAVKVDINEDLITSVNEAACSINSSKLESCVKMPFLPQTTCPDLLETQEFYNSRHLSLKPKLPLPLVPESDRPCAFSEPTQEPHPLSSSDARPRYDLDHIANLLNSTLIGRNILPR